MHLFPDVNECATDQHGCHENANCTNLHGTHKCDCNDGYIGDGSSCTGKNLLYLQFCPFTF